MDAKNNYELIHAMEGPSYTEVQFYRPLHTSDCADDIEIVVRIKFWILFVHFK